MFVKLLHCSIVAAVLTLSAVPAGARRHNAVSLKASRAAIIKNPGNAMNYYRVFLYGRTPAHMEEAESLLRWSFQKYPGIYRIEVFIAWLDRMRGKAGWEATLRHAIDGMESTGDTWGVVYGGEDLAYALMDRGKLAEAGALLARCAPAARKTGNRPMQARIWAAQGVLAEKRGDYSQSLHLLLRAKKWAFPDGDYDIRCSVMNNLGTVYWYLCRYQKAYDSFRQAALLRAQSGDAWGEGVPVSNMALCGIKLVHEGDMAPRELQNLLNRGLRLAIRSRNIQVEADIHNLLGLQSQGREALRHFQRTLELARRRSLPQDEIEALEFSGTAAAGMGPQFRTQSEQFFRRAREKAHTIGNAFNVAEIQAAEARMKALFASRQEGIDAQRRALDLIEALRAPQVRGTLRAQAFSHWSYVYYRLAGFLLQGSAVSATPRKDRALAFGTMERFRARELLEHLETPRRISATQAGSEFAERREAVLAQISKAQRKLADPELPAPRRAETLDRLANLEEQESALRDQVLRRSRGRVAASQHGIPTLAQVQSLLGPDQAMLSFQLWDGEPWEPRPLAIG
ncbi:MAG: tetratricopeptide repeat protein, partial [Acidobacteria bacterium]|nr:tetratricopeptide repeat protein [Acidobacteriota bacterium]